MNYIYKNRDDWGSASVNYSWGLNGALRGASNRKLKFKDLNLSYSFGAEDIGPLSRCLLLVLRTGNVHKDRHDTEKQVGSWRHKKYNFCSVFAMAAYVIYNLNNEFSNINFYHRDKNESPAWWDLPLIDWEQYSGK